MGTASRRFNEAVTIKSGEFWDAASKAHLRSFKDLVQDRVQRILLVSSLYDSFILSEEGQLQDTLLGQFHDLNLSQVPDLTRVSEGAEAIERLQRPGEFDLVISSVRAGTINAVELTRQLREIGIYVPVLVLAYSNRELTDFMVKHDTSVLDGMFLWQGDARILMAMVKYVEDRQNVAHDTGNFGVPAIIVVEDNVRYYSSFLPVIFTEILQHMQRLLSEDLNMEQRMLRMRARPKVLLCRSYEEAWSFFTRFEQHILGVISDIEFPHDGRLNRTAGLELTSRIHEAHPDLRIVLQSSLPENRALAEVVGGSFLLKGSPLLLTQLRRILRERFGFGDFIFRLPDHTEVDRAHDLKSLIEKLRTIPIASLVYHAERNHFSNWLKARTEFALGEELRPQKVDAFDNPELLREHLLKTIRTYRDERDRAVVADFNPFHAELRTAVSRIGSGSLGGKARGIAFASRVLQRVHLQKDFPDVDVFVPTSIVLATSVFDEFVDQSGLRDFAIASESDEEILAQFLSEPFPEAAVEDLRAFLLKIHYPLAVRSSSLLEDSFAQPFAGVYQTKMVANNEPLIEDRLTALLNAVKRVYASTFTMQAKSYIDLTAYRVEEEKMAVLIQRLVGRHHGDHFYPDFAGVARSHNFYPQPPAECEDGVVAVALGLGRTVVDGGPCVRFSPKYPGHVIAGSTVEEVLNNAQREFFALALKRGADERGEPVGVRRCGLDVAERDGVLAWVGSTYLSEDHRVVDGISRDGARIVSFANVLKPSGFPLAEIAGALLEHCSRGTSGPIEIEFAGNLGTDGERPELGFLQLRPLALSSESEEVEIGSVLDDALMCRSSTVLGNGRISDIQDVILVDIHLFERQESAEVARIVGSMNSKLQKSGRPYVLVGVGRWGSSDPHLGIPVRWNQIGGARVVVEAGFKDFRVTPSQGTHFFQNLTSCNVGFFTVNPDTGDGFVDWKWLGEQEAEREEGPVRLIHLSAPLEVKMSGRTGQGVIIKPTSLRRGSK